MIARTLRHLSAGLLALVAQLGFADQSIYADALLNGWENWSWAATNLAAASPVHGGSKSVAGTTGPWQAL